MSAAGMLVLWFSKDRAFQLSEALRTFTRFAEQPQESHVRHAVLYAHSSIEHARSYVTLASALPGVAFIDEMCAPDRSHSQGTSNTAAAARLSTSSQQQPSHFAAHLSAMFDSSTEQFVLLCVDDVLFIAPFSLGDVPSLFASSSLLSYHMALHPGLTFHQPSSSPLTRPAFTSAPSAALSHSPSHAPSLLFSHSAGAGSHDFRYPFSLAASVYRSADLRCIVSDLSSSRALPFHHPNLLESSANALITTRSSIPAAVRAFLPPPSASDASNLCALRPLSAVPSRPLCVVITVNRVQDVYSNAVFDSSDDGSVEAMLQRFDSGGWQFDEDRYGEMAAQGRSTSVHVGELMWKRREGGNVS